MPEHATKTAPHWVVSGRSDLPLAADAPWDGAGAKARLFDYAGFNSAKPNPGKLAGAFLIHDANKPLDKASYQYPFATVRAGTLVAVPAGIRAAKSRAAEFEDGVLRARMMGIVDGYLRQMGADVSAETAKAWTESELVVYQGGAVKSLGSNRYGGYLYTFTTAKQRDLTDEWFDAGTDFMLPLYPIKGIHALFDHGFNPSLHSIPVGQIVDMRVDSKGIYVEEHLDFLNSYKSYIAGLKQPQAWMDEQEDMAAEYAKYIERLLRDGKLNWSGGAHPPSVRKSANGHIDRWATIEASNTRTPAMPFTNRITPVKSLQFTPLDARLSADALREDAHERPIEAQADTEAHPGVWNVQAPNPTALATETPPMKFTVDEARPIADDVAAQIVAQLAADKSPLQIGDVKMFASQIASEAVKAAPMDDEMDGDEANADEMDENARSEKMLDAIWDAAHQLTAQRVAKQELAKNRVKSLTSSALESGIAYAAEYQRKGESRTRGFSDEGDGSVKRFSFNRLDDKEYGPGLLSAIKSQMPMTFGYQEASKYSQGSVKGASKALNPYAGATGGYLLSNELAPTILDPLRAQSIAFKLGVTQQMLGNTGSYSIAKMTVAPTAFRPGINTDITASTPTYQAITLFPKPIAAMTIIPRQQLLAGLPDTEDQIRRQLVKSIQLQVDQEIFIGTGSVVSPDTGAGIRGILQVANTVTSAATNGRQLQFTDLIAAQTELENQNVTDDNSNGYALHPTMRGTLRSMTDTTGQPLFRNSYNDAAFMDVIGYPLQVSTQIPKNITTGTNTNTSYMFYGRWSDGVYGMLNDVAILVDEITLMNDLQVRIIAYTFSDFVVKYPQSFYVLSGITA